MRDYNALLLCGFARLGEYVICKPLRGFANCYAVNPVASNTYSSAPATCPKWYGRKKTIFECSPICLGDELLKLFFVFCIFWLGEPSVDILLSLCRKIVIHHKANI